MVLSQISWKLRMLSRLLAEDARVSADDVTKWAQSFCVEVNVEPSVLEQHKISATSHKSIIKTGSFSVNVNDLFYFHSMLPLLY